MQRQLARARRPTVCLIGWPISGVALRLVSSPPARRAGRSREQLREPARPSERSHRPAGPASRALGGRPAILYLNTLTHCFTLCETTGCGDRVQPASLPAASVQRARHCAIKFIRWPNGDAIDFLWPRQPHKAAAATLARPACARDGQLVQSLSKVCLSVYSICYAICCLDETSPL